MDQRVDLAVVQLRLAMAKLVTLAKPPCSIAVYHNINIYSIYRRYHIRPPSGAEYIRQLRQERQQQQEEMDQLKQNIETLNAAIRFDIGNCEYMQFLLTSYDLV